MFNYYVNQIDMLKTIIHANFISFTKQICLTFTYKYNVDVAAEDFKVSSLFFTSYFINVKVILTSHVYAIFAFCKSNYNRFVILNFKGLLFAHSVQGARKPQND